MAEMVEIYRMCHFNIMVVRELPSTIKNHFGWVYRPNALIPQEKVNVEKGIPHAIVMYTIFLKFVYIKGSIKNSM